MCGITGNVARSSFSSGQGMQAIAHQSAMESISWRRRKLLAALLASATLPSVTAASAKPQFRIFDGLAHRGKPDLTKYGIEPITPVAHIWRANNSHDTVDELGLALALNRLPTATATIFLDIEVWPLDPADPSVLRASLAKMTTVAQAVRHISPQMKFGFYGAPPIRVYWPILKHDTSYQQWLSADRTMSPLAMSVDYIFPSLYTFYADPKGWLLFAEAQLQEARQYRKPVYPFLWYQYHDSNRFLRGHEIAADAWEQELRFCRDEADGVVLWGGTGEDWNEGAVWWQKTRQVFNLHQP
jgi:hypothetical protein